MSAHSSKKIRCFRVNVAFSFDVFIQSITFVRTNQLRSRSQILFWRTNPVAFKLRFDASLSLRDCGARSQRRGACVPSFGLGVVSLCVRTWCDKLQLPVHVTMHRSAVRTSIDGTCTSRNCGGGAFSGAFVCFPVALTSDVVAPDVIFIAYLSQRHFH